MKLFTKLRNWYWRIWPYDWRPGQIWYRLKCWAWYRYTTIKSRYLDHTWHDRRNIVPHTMFEILSQFIEQECSPGHVEWYGEYGHKITVNGEEKYVRDEMQDLYDWWHQVWNQRYEQVSDILWTEALKHRPRADFVPIEGTSLYELNSQFATEDDALCYNKCFDALNKLEANMERKLQEQLHRLVNLIPYMWT